MSSSPLFHHKRGDTFEVACVYQDENEVPISLAGITVASEIRDNTGILVATLAATVTNESGGEFSLASTASTVNWPLTRLEWDIKYSFGSTVVRTETVCINVVKHVTA